MIDQFIQDLQSSDPAVRRSAIIALANAKNAAALPSLNHVYHNDPDPKLRELALKAGRYIHQQNSPSVAQAAETPVEVSPDDVVVSARDIERASSYLDAAIGHHTRGDRARAVENLGKALAINPKLQKEHVVANLIVTLTNRPTREGAAILADPERRAAYIDSLGGKTKLLAQTHGKGAESATWTNVMIDLGLYWLISVLAMIAILVFSLKLIQDLFNSLPTTTTGGGMPTSTDFDLIETTSIAVLIPAAMINGIYGVVAILIQGAAIHFAATTFLGGNGALVYLYRRVVPFQTVVTLASAVGFVGLSLISEDFDAILALVSGVSAVGGIVIAVLLAQIVGQVYNFGAGNGCAAIVGGSILLMLLFGCGYCLLFSALGNIANAAM